MLTYNFDGRTQSSFLQGTRISLGVLNRHRSGAAAHQSRRCTRSVTTSSTPMRQGVSSRHASPSAGNRPCDSTRTSDTRYRGRRSRLLTAWPSFAPALEASRGECLQLDLSGRGRPAPTLITGAALLIGDGTRVASGDVLIVDGRHRGGRHGLVGAGRRSVIDARGRWVTPGLIDIHSHVGVLSSPYVSAHSDGNEMTHPVTANVWVEHSVWTQDPAFQTALEGGITTLQILPGSANLVGGRSVVLKNVPSVSVRGTEISGCAHRREDGVR